MSSMVRLLPWFGLMLALAGCKSLSFDRKDFDERRSEVQLALYVTERANPNPNAPVESDPAKPPIRIELSGNNLNDMAAQLAAMAKVIEQERQAPGSVRPAPVTIGEVDPDLGADSIPPPSKVGKKGKRRKAEKSGQPEKPEKPEKPESVASNAVADSAPTDPAAFALPGLPPTAVLEQHAATSKSGDDAAVPPRTLGTYRDEDVTEAAPGSVTLQRGKPSPLTIQVVQLSDDSLLLNADYDALAIDLKKALGSTYVRHDDYVLKPGQYKTVPLRKLDKDALYLGVIAGYHETDLRRWKAVYRLDPSGHRYGVLMVFDEEGATIQTEQLR